MLAQIFDAAAEVVYAALAFGVVEGVAEWLVLRRDKR